MAVMVHYGLFVGSAADTYKFSGSILHCAKDPWYIESRRRVFQRNWDGTCPKLQCNDTVIQIQYNEMALNMVDAEHPKYFSDEMVNAGLDFITERFAEGDAVLCHCNMGVSRSPSIAMLWMFEHGFLDNEFRYAVPQFKDLYKNWMPANGVWQYVKARCEKSNNGTRSNN
jgi:hypothetical protein